MLQPPPLQPQPRRPAFRLEEPPWRRGWEAALPQRRNAQPPSLARELSLTRSAARLPLPPARRPFTPAIAGRSRRRQHRPLAPRRIDGAREQQIGCCHACLAADSWSWRGACSCGGVDERLAPQWRSARFSPKSRERPISSGIIEQITAWIPRTTPEPLTAADVLPAADKVFVFEEEAADRSTVENSAIDWAEELQHSLEVEERRLEAQQRRAERDAAARAEEEAAAAAAAAAAAERDRAEEGAESPKADDAPQPRNQKGKNSPRRLTRQMTLARELSTDDQNPKTKTLKDLTAGTTAWVGGLPYDLATDKAALHALLSKHGGDLQAITVRLKPPAVAGDNKSWCFATYTNEDAVARLQAAATTVAVDSSKEETDKAERERAPPPPQLELVGPSSPREDDDLLTPLVAREDVEYKFDENGPIQSPSNEAAKSEASPRAAAAAAPADVSPTSLMSLELPEQPSESALPPSIVVKAADVEGTLFTRKLEAIFSGRLMNMKMNRGQLAKSNTSMGRMESEHKRPASQPGMSAQSPRPRGGQ
jgi:hypothetical protein